LHLLGSTRACAQTTRDPTRQFPRDMDQIHAAVTSLTQGGIPDPKSDLHWSDFKGPIHEIFAGNARKHPERPCVVETATSKTPERKFTYKQIFEATSVLSHHLVQNGIQRGEVVMIFAHRGVDLVVAIMAVLAAGATFSVLDPL
jgi:L-aminoadipate-semialdehyde dehydrogenase